MLLDDLFMESPCLFLASILALGGEGSHKNSVDAVEFSIKN